MILVPVKNINNLSSSYSCFLDSSYNDLHQMHCPSCGLIHSLVFNGHYRRHYITEDGARHSLSVQRCLCKHCHRSHSLLPSCLVPYLLYALCLVRKALDHVKSVIEDSYAIRLRKRSACLPFSHHLHPFYFFHQHNIPNTCSFLPIQWVQEVDFL